LARGHALIPKAPGLPPLVDFEIFIIFNLLAYLAGIRTSNGVEPPWFILIPRHPPKK
jgi:hypothetical protein